MKNLKRFVPGFIGMLALLMMVVGLQVDAAAQQDHAYWGKYKVDKASYDVLAPNFPTPEQMLSKSSAGEEYQMAFDRWAMLYSHEYVAFFNNMEKTNVKPYHFFIHARIGDEEPVMKNTGDAYADEINFQLRSQKWVFVNQPDQFMSRFGFQPNVSDSELKSAETWDFSRTK